METALESQEKGIVDYNLTDQAIAAMREKYMPLLVTDLEDKEQLEAVHEARLDIKTRRVQVEKHRKELVSDAVAWQKKANGEAKRIVALLAPIENHLIAEEKKVTDEQDRIKAEEAALLKATIDERIVLLKAVGCYSVSFQELAAMTEEDFDTALFDATEECEEAKRIREEQEAAREAEVERLEEIRLEQEAERERLQKERDEQEALAIARQSALDEENAIQEAKIQREREAIETERRTLEDEKARIAKEEADKLAAEQAEIERKALEEERKELEAVRIAREKEEAENEAARHEALKPDKQKLLAYIVSLQEVVEPELSSNEARETMNRLQETLTFYVKAIEEL